MKSNLRYILFCLLIFVCQVLINNYLNLGVYVYVFLIPYIILFLPYKVKTINLMLLAFLLGLGVDIFGNGVLGLNTAALTALAFCRNFFLSRIVNEKNVDKNYAPTSYELGFGHYVAYISLSLLVFFLFYVPLDNMSLTPLLFNTLRIVIGCIVNTLLIASLGALTQTKRR